MIAIDTNVLVRLFVADDPAQSPRAAKIFASEDVLVPKTVVLETEWVLRFSYALPRKTIAGAFRTLLGAASVTVEDSAAVRGAVDRYVAGMDFADALHLASSGTAAKFLTFDKKLARAAARSKTSPTVQIA